jgi:hypothetical protein
MMWMQRALEQYNGSLEKAKLSFQKKFLDKSGNEWPLAGPFEKVGGKYVLVGTSSCRSVGLVSLEENALTHHVASQQS